MDEKRRFMTNGLILGLSGYKGSGKDSVASILVKQHGFQRVAFADVLKDLVADLYDVERSAMDDPERKEKPILSLPVNPKDGFGDKMFELQYGELRDADGWAPNPLHDTQLYHTPRSLCILIGSVNRFVRSDYWVARALSQIKPGFNYVISDMRYRSEASQIKEFSQGMEMAAQTVRIERFAGCNSTDPSEHDLDDHQFDQTLVNSGTLADLELKVQSLLDNYFPNP